MSHWSEADARLVFHPFTPYKKGHKNVVVTHAEGVWLYTDDGRKILDAVGSWWVNIHGHCHPYINEKVKAQLDTLEHVMYSGFTHAPSVTLAEKLLHLAGPHFSQVFYSDNGSTAVEVALKMAIQFHANRGENRRKFLAFENSYHGDTFGAMAVSERDVFTEPFHHWLFSAEYLPVPTAENAPAILKRLGEIPAGEIAGCIFEPLVQGAGGMRIYPPEVLDLVIASCREKGILTIADEVMTGFGRTGKTFATDYLQQKTDFLCLSKGITGGYLPLGATLITNDVAREFRSEEAVRTFYHGHSYTANPLACTAAVASAELLDTEECRAQIAMITEAHKTFVQKTANHPAATGVRSVGTILALDVQVNPGEYFYLHPLRDRLYDFFMQRGALLRPLGNVIYLVPPYCITAEELQWLYSLIEECLDTFASEYGKA